MEATRFRNIVFVLTLMMLILVLLVFVPYPTLGQHSGNDYWIPPVEHNETDLSLEDYLLMWSHMINEADPKDESAIENYYNDLVDLNYIDASPNAKYIFSMIMGSDSPFFNTPRPVPEYNDDVMDTYDKPDDPPRSAASRSDFRKDEDGIRWSYLEIIQASPHAIYLNEDRDRFYVGDSPEITVATDYETFADNDRESETLEKDIDEDGVYKKYRQTKYVRSARTSNNDLELRAKGDTFNESTVARGTGLVRESIDLSEAEPNEDITIEAERDLEVTVTIKEYDRTCERFKDGTRSCGLWSFRTDYERDYSTTVEDEITVQHYELDPSITYSGSSGRYYAKYEEANDMPATALVFDSRVAVDFPYSTVAHFDDTYEDHFDYPLMTQYVVPDQASIKMDLSEVDDAKLEVTNSGGTSRSSEYVEDGSFIFEDEGITPGTAPPPHYLVPNRAEFFQESGFPATAPRNIGVQGPLSDEPTIPDLNQRHELQFTTVTVDSQKEVDNGTEFNISLTSDNQPIRTDHLEYRYVQAVNNEGEPIPVEGTDDARKIQTDRRGEATFSVSDKYNLSEFEIKEDLSEASELSTEDRFITPTKNPVGNRDRGEKKVRDTLIETIFVEFGLPIGIAYLFVFFLARGLGVDLRPWRF